MLSIKVPIQKRKHIKVKSFDIQKTQVQEKIVARPEEEFHFCLTKRRRATSIFTSCCEYGKAYDLLYYSRLGQHHSRQNQGTSKLSSKRMYRSYWYTTYFWVTLKSLLQYVPGQLGASIFDFVQASFINPHKVCIIRLVHICF